MQVQPLRLFCCAFNCVLTRASNFKKKPAWFVVVGKKIFARQENQKKDNARRKECCFSWC
jgi:hypothetical protein